MKSISITALAFIIFLFSVKAYGQVWQQYGDSAKFYQDQKNYVKAIEFSDKAKTELQKDSAGTISYAASCKYLASLYWNINELNKAVALYLEAKEIQEKVLGKHNTIYAFTSENLAIVYGLLKLYDKAEPLHMEVKEILEKVLGRENTNYANLCNNIAFFYSSRGQHNKAVPLYLEVKRIREKVLGKENTAYVNACRDLANEYGHMSQYDKAELLYLEAMQIQEKQLGKEKRDYINTCHSLAILYTRMGQYDKSEQLYLGAMQKEEKLFGKEGSKYGSICNDLAVLYMTMGLYDKALPLYLESEKIDEKVSGKQSSEYAISCSNLAILYSKMGNYYKSEPLYLEAMQIEEKVSGRESFKYANFCGNLAVLYYNLSQYDKAESLFVEAMRILEKVSGKESPEYANECSDLASVYEQKDWYDKAEPLRLEARQIQEKVLGKGHPEYGSTCAELANLYWARQQPLLAEKEFKESFAVGARNLISIFQFTNEKEKTAYIKNKLGEDNEAYSFYVSSGLQPGQPYALSLFHRNLVLSSLQALKKQLSSSIDTTLINKYDEWLNLKKYLSAIYAEPIADREEDVAKIEEKTDQLEKELTRLSSAFKKQQQEVSIKDIQSQLKPGEASIEFVSYSFYNGKRITDSTYYIALILRKDKPTPQLVHLFEERQLEAILNRNDRSAESEKINTIYSGNSAVFELTWKPLEKYLTGIKKIYFASAGDLFKIAFAALQVNAKQVLGDKYQLIQLNTTASVIDNNESLLTAADKIQLYGGIQYDVDSLTLKQAVYAYRGTATGSRSLPDDLTRGADFNYLPGTAQEIEEIKSETDKVHIPVTILSGPNATEESLKALNGKASPSVLHIATHGFFFPDPKTIKSDIFQQKFENAKVFRQSDNPLFRSGLLFAGANNAWQGKPIEGIEDGILTAYEVSDLYLPNTKLVVLSACETALGDIQGSEGVYGLQRAFKIAGAQNLVMSLWKVPDTETAEFMKLFYKNLFARQSIQNAFYNTQNVMKNKYRGKPYQWAAWVLVR